MLISCMFVLIVVFSTIEFYNRENATLLSYIYVKEVLISNVVYIFCPVDNCCCCCCCLCQVENTVCLLVEMADNEMKLK